MDALYGCLIKALKEKGLSHDEIAKIIARIQELEDELEETEAQSIYYEFPTDF